MVNFKKITKKLPPPIKVKKNIKIMKLGVFEINYGKSKHIESFPHQKTPKFTTWEIWGCFSL